MGIYKPDFRGGDLTEGRELIYYYLPINPIKLPKRPYGAIEAIFWSKDCSNCKGKLEFYWFSSKVER